MGMIEEKIMVGWDGGGVGDGGIGRGGGLAVQADGLDNNPGHLVGVAVRGRSSILQVAVTLLCHVPRDPDTAASVGHTGREVVDGGRLVGSSQTSLIVLSFLRIVCLDVSDVMFGQSVNGIFNCLDPSLLSHGYSREVSVSSSSVPVSRHWLGVEGDDHTEVF